MTKRDSPPVHAGVEDHRGAENEPGGRVNLEHSLGLAELDALAAHVDGSFVLVVHVTGDRYRRRCFLTAQSAQRAADRATARGDNATVYLAELKPLYRLVGGEHV